MEHPCSSLYFYFPAFFLSLGFFNVSSSGFGHVIYNVPPKEKMIAILIKYPTVFVD